MGAVEKLELGFGQFVYLVPRDGWGALPGDLTPLRPPISRVRFTFTGLAGCNSPEECLVKTKELEMFYRNKGHPDLPYNFLVGGDGRVYEGGGWNYDTEKKPKHIWLKGKTISIAYMGNFSREDPPYLQLHVALEFVKYGLKMKFIHPLFSLEELGAESRAGT
ncbi:peptidoglycan recognition protein 1-like isoform X2 [Macrosteles quadrilineatus]|uniref:peptidoglycan recognition protein 1-like isoform X2 n=1 Tax=Macrosteles quadrilineatus TaxID=74068 RepID=UPI0023E10599|nr:peptidoglycan recognition protein 1-like isoform X2 [Macrosteles quadrilineatus]